VNRSQWAVVQATLELLVLPHPKEVIAQHLLNNIDPLNATLSIVNATGMLFAALPSPFHSVLYTECRTVIKSNNLFFQNANMGFNPFVRNIFTDYTNNIKAGMDNAPNRLLVLMHSFFHYGSIVYLFNFPGLVRYVRPVKSTIQILFLCKLIGPFIYRLANNIEIIREILVELFGCLLDISQSTQITSTEFGLEEIIDFLYHCNYVFKLNQQTLKDLNDIIQQLHPYLKTNFSHIYR